MEPFVIEMYEDFIMSEACSRFYAFDAQEFEAQDEVIYNKYMNHAEFCKKAAKVCSDFLKIKDKSRFISKLRKLGLIVNIIKLDLNV